MPAADTHPCAATTAAAATPATAAAAATASASATPLCVSEVAREHGKDREDSQKAAQRFGMLVVHPHA